MGGASRAHTRGICIMGLFRKKPKQLRLRMDDSDAGNLWDAVLKRSEPPPPGFRTTSCAPVVYSQKLRNDDELCCDETLVKVLHTIAKPTGQRAGLLNLALESIVQDSRTLVISQEASAPTPLITIQPDRARYNEHAAIKVVEKHVVQVFEVSKKGYADLQSMGNMWVTAAYRVSSPKLTPGRYLLSDLKLEVGSFAGADTSARVLSAHRGMVYTPTIQQDVVEAGDDAVEKYCASLLSRRTNNIPDVSGIPKDLKFRLKEKADAVTCDRGKTPWDLIRTDVAYDFAEEGEAQIIEAQIEPSNKMQLHCVALLGGMQCDPKLVNVLKHTLKPTTERGCLLNFLESCIRSTDSTPLRYARSHTAENSNLRSLVDSCGQSTNIKISATGITKNPVTVVHPIIVGDPSVSAVRVAEVHCVKVMKRSGITGTVECIGALEAIVQFTLCTTDNSKECSLGDLRVTVKPISLAGRATKNQLTHNSTYAHTLPLDPRALHGHTKLGDEKFHVPYVQDVVLPKDKKGILPTSRVSLKHSADTAMRNIAKTPWDLIKTGAPYGTPNTQPGAHSKLLLFDNIGRGIGTIQRDEQMVEFARNVVQPTSIRPGLLQFLEKCIDTKNPSIRVLAHSSNEPSLKATLTYVTEGVTFPMVKVEETHLVDVVDISGKSGRILSDLLVGHPNGISVQDVLEVKLSYEISHHSPNYLFKNMRAEIKSMGQNGNRPQQSPLVVNFNARYRHDETLEGDDMQRSSAYLRKKAATALQQGVGGQSAGVSSAAGGTGVGSTAPDITLKHAPDQAMRNAAKTPWDLICGGDRHEQTVQAASCDNVETFTKNYLLKPTKCRAGLLEFVRACVQDGSNLYMETNTPKIRVDVEKDGNGQPVSPVTVTEEHFIRVSRNGKVLVLSVQVAYKVNKTQVAKVYALSDMQVAVKSMGSDGRSPSTQELRHSIKACERVPKLAPKEPTAGNSTAKTQHLETEEDEYGSATLRNGLAEARGTANEGASYNIFLASPKDCQKLVDDRGLCEFVMGKDWVREHVDDATTPRVSASWNTSEQLAFLTQVLTTKPGGNAHKLLLTALAACIATPHVELDAQSVTVKKRNIVDSGGATAIKVEEKHNVKARSIADVEPVELGDVSATLSYVISADSAAQNVFFISDVKLHLVVEDEGIEQNINFGGKEIVTIADELQKGAKSKGVAKKSAVAEADDPEEETELEEDELKEDTKPARNVKQGAKSGKGAKSKGVAKKSAVAAADDPEEETELEEDELDEGSLVTGQDKRKGATSASAGAATLHNGLPTESKKGLALADPKACQQLVKDQGLAALVLGRDWRTNHMDDSGTTPNLEHLSIDEQRTLLSTVLDTTPSSTHALLLDALKKCISTPSVTLTARSMQINKSNITDSGGGAAIRVEAKHSVGAERSTTTGQAHQTPSDVDATLHYTISVDKDAQNIIISDVKLNVATGHAKKEISFSGIETVKLPNKLLRAVADKFRGHDPNEEQESRISLVDARSNSGATPGQKKPSHDATHAKPSAGAGSTAVADQDTAGSSMQASSSGAQHGEQHPAPTEPVGNAVFTLKTAPDQTMRDAVPHPWSLIYAGQHHEHNSKSAKSGDMQDFCAKFLYQEPSKRDGLLNFIKTSICFDPNADLKVVAGERIQAHTSAKSLKCDPDKKTALVVVTEHHNFIVKNNNDEGVGTLTAEIRYEVTPTIQQDKYKISNLTVNIKSPGSSTTLLYKSTRTSEVSLPVPDVTKAPQRPLTSSDAAQKPATTFASPAQRIAATASALAPARMSSDPEQDKNIANYLEEISRPSSPEESVAAGVGTTTAQSRQAGTQQPASQPNAPATPAFQLKSAADQVMRSAAETPWSLIYGGHKSETEESTGSGESIEDFLKKYLLKPTRQREGLLEFAKACMYNGGSLSTHATDGPKIIKPPVENGVQNVQEVHNIQVKDTQTKEVLDVLAVKVSYNIRSTDTDGEYELSDLKVLVKSLGSDGRSPSEAELTYEINTKERVSRQNPPKFTKYVVPALSAEQDAATKLREQSAQKLLQAVQQGGAQSYAKSTATQAGSVSAPPSEIILCSDKNSSDVCPESDLPKLVLGNEWHARYGRSVTNRTTIDPKMFSEQDAQFSLLHGVLGAVPNVTNGCLLDALQNTIGTPDVVLVDSPGNKPIVTAEELTNSDGSVAILVQEQHVATAKYWRGNTRYGSAVKRAAARNAKNIGNVHAILSYIISTEIADGVAHAVISNVELAVAPENAEDVQNIRFEDAESRVPIAGDVLQGVVAKLQGLTSVGTQSGSGFGRRGSIAATKSKLDSIKQHATEAQHEASQDEDSVSLVAQTDADEEEWSKAAGKASSSMKTARDAGATSTHKTSSIPVEQDDTTDSDAEEEYDITAPKSGRWSATRGLQAMEQRREAGMAARNAHSKAAKFDTYGSDDEDLNSEDYKEEDYDLLEDDEVEDRAAHIAKPAHHIRSGGAQGGAAGVYDESEVWHQTRQSARGTVIKKTQLFADNGRFNFVDEVRNALRDRDNLLCQEIFYPTDDDISFETNLFMRIAEASVTPLGGPEAAENVQVVGNIKSEVDFSDLQQEFDVVKSATVDAGIHGTLYISVRYQVAKEASVYSTNYVIKNAAIHLGRTENSGATVLPIDDVVSAVNTPWRTALAEYKAKQKSAFRAGTLTAGGGAQKNKGADKQEKRRAQQKRQPIPEFTEEDALHTVPVSTGQVGWFSKILGCVRKFFGAIFKFFKNLFGVRSTVHDDFAKYGMDIGKFIENKPGDSHGAHLSHTNGDVRHNAQAEVDDIYHDEYDDFERLPRHSPKRPPSEVISDSTVHPAGERATAARRGRR
ncbi:hypothetical protein F0Q58_00165 [Anaplasma marginale]|nr:hypothetical protein F0Q58_00165 [Anaplasma marginale]KAB0451426.1 hypothetical protein FY210_00165 [Anaplasma marginale]